MDDLHLMNIRGGTDDDLNVLSDLSRKLFWELNPTGSNDHDQIRERISHTIHSDSQAFLFEINKNIIGYSLVSKITDPCSVEEFFIIPEERGKFYGNAAVALLSDITKWTAVKVDATVWHAMAGGM